MSRMMSSMELRGLIQISLSNTNNLINSTIYYIIAHKGKKSLTELENALEAMRGIKTRLTLKLGLLDDSKTPDNAKIARIYKEVDEATKELGKIQRNINKFKKEK